MSSSALSLRSTMTPGARRVRAYFAPVDRSTSTPAAFDLARDGQFGLDYALLGIFHVDLGPLGDAGLSRRTVAGRDLLVARAGTQELLVGERVEPPRTLGAWQRRLGDYEITNLDHDRKFLERIRLTEERGFLLAELTAANPRGQTQRVLLKPLSDSEALVLGPLSDAGETLRVQSVNGEERLTTSGYQARRVGR